MFRLKERQLHMLLGLLFGASVLLFCIFGIRAIPASTDEKNTSEMEDFSEAWVCTYDTRDADKIKEYQKRKEDAGTGESCTVTEIVNLPAVVPVEEGKKVTMTHKLPEMSTDMIYLMVQTNRQAIQVYVGNDILYSSEEEESNLPAYHVIPVSAQYQNMVATVELQGQNSGQMKIGAISVGSYNEVLMQAFHENGYLFITGLFLISTSICLLVVWLLMENTWKQKKALLYALLEGSLLGLLFVADSRLVQVVSGWNYVIYLFRACLVILTAIMHLMLTRCYIYKKKIIFLVDIGILFYGIFYVSVMVLQAFSLISFAAIYQAGSVLFGIGILLYTIILAVATYIYRQKEGRIILAANGILLLGVLLQIIIRLLKIQSSTENIYVLCGLVFYMVIVWIFGLKQTLELIKEEKGVSEEEIRSQIIRQMNPNLLFASFQTLQNLIKSGSSKSVKMIYYISVYIRDNLKAISQMGEIISFEEELEHIIAYLQLQKMRNQDIDFAIECKIKEFRIPRHSIEPIVENAVKYGIANHGNKGNVVIRSYQRAEGYGVQVIDDGIGFETNHLTRKSPTALLNLFTMLETACQAKTDLISKEGKGTVITIVLPILENDVIEEENSL